MRRPIIWIAVLLVAAFSFAGFSYSSTFHHSPAKALTASVTITGSTGTFAYKPATIKVKKGTAVTWTNKTSQAHTVTNSGGGMNYNKNVNPGKKVTIKYTKIGTFKYHCIFHSNMHGKVIVHK